MLGHLSFGVADLERSIAVYDAALAPLGLTRVWTKSSAAGYGFPGTGDLLALKVQSSPVRPPALAFIWPLTPRRMLWWTPSILKHCEPAEPTTGVLAFGYSTGRPITPPS